MHNIEHHDSMVNAKGEANFLNHNHCNDCRFRWGKVWKHYNGCNSFAFTISRLASYSLMGGKDFLASCRSCGFSLRRVMQNCDVVSRVICFCEAQNRNENKQNEKDACG